MKRRTATRRTRDPLAALPNLPREVGKLLAQIPAGRVTTYGALAEALGHVRAARWVATFLARHPHRVGCNCHRVVRKDGSLGQYVSGNLADKAALLQREGIPVNRGCVNLAACEPVPLRCTAPLAALQEIQRALIARVSLAPPLEFPRLAAGVDVSYPAPGMAVGCYTLVDIDRGELVWSITRRLRVRFPYITGFLSFRELPVFRALLAAARRAQRMADVVLVDGSGLLHPRQAGIATHLGVVENLPTIGVTKTLLAGQVDRRGIVSGGQRSIRLDDRELGVALRPTEAEGLIYISPGHRVDVATAAEVCRRLLTGRKLPEPVYWADRLSRQAGASLKRSM